MNGGNLDSRVWMGGWVGRDTRGILLVFVVYGVILDGWMGGGDLFILVMLEGSC